MSKYIITKKKQPPCWMSVGIVISSIIYLIMGICKIAWDVKNTEITGVEA